MPTDVDPELQRSHPASQAHVHARRARPVVALSELQKEGRVGATGSAVYSAARESSLKTCGLPQVEHVGYLSKAFAEIRDQLEPFKSMPAAQRPGFHEIRGLGARLYRATGMPEEAIQGLMTHSNPRTTQIYLDRGAAALSDRDYKAVTATMRLSEIMGTKGTE